IPAGLRAQFHRLDGFLGKASPLVAGRVLGACLTVVVPMVLARRLTRDDFGTYKQFFLVFLTVCLIGQLGLTQSLFYFVPRDAESRGRYLGQTLIGLVAVGLLAGATIALTPWFGPFRVPLAVYCAAGLIAALLDTALTSLG